MAATTPIERIALVSPYDFATSGGVTEHVRQLARHLRRQGIDVTIIAPASAPVDDEPNLLSLGPITPVPINGSVARTTLSPVVAENVATLLAREHFDVIHLHEPFVPMLPISVLNASPSPNVATFHAFGQRSLSYAASRKFVHWMAQRLTLRIAVSAAAERFVRRYIGGEYIIIPNGVDLHRFRPDVLPVDKWMDGRPNVLFVGRFEEPRKGFPVLLDAWGAVQKARPDVRLLVVGRGEAAPLRQQAHDAGYQNIHFVGSVSGADLPRYYATATTLCAPSTGQESFGIILVEAMSSGTPVVASDIVGYRDVLHHRREGLLVPSQQPNALAAALLHLLGDTELREALGESGRVAAREYAWEGVAGKVIDVYERAQRLHRSAQPPLRGSRGTATQDARTHRSAQGPRKPADVVTPSQLSEGEVVMLTEPFEARVRAFTQRLAARLLGRSGISPNTLTAVGLLLTVTVTYTLATGHLALGGVLVLLTSAFDMLDGALARATDRKSAFGAFFDSTVDRYTEALVLLGLLLYYEHFPGARWEVPLVYISIVGSLMVSYTRARAEGLGFDGKVGILARPERIILLAIGLIFGWLAFALVILAILTNVTAAQRVYYVWRQDRARNPRPVVPKVPRRGWFAPRDQTPS